MHLAVSSREFLRELELLVKVVAQKPTIPSLGNILVHAEGTGMRLAATDLEIGIITFCPAMVHQPGTTTIPAKHLLEIIKLLPDRELTLVLEKTTVHLTADRYQTHLPTFPISDYPQLPSMKDLPTVTLPVTFQTMIRQVRFAISEKETRYFLSGGLLTRTALVTTDGHRLAYTTCVDSGLETPVIIPSKTLDKLVDMPATDAIFATGPKHLFFVMDGRLVFSRMVEGKFPQYERILPRDTTYKMTVDRLAFQEALQRVVLTSTEVVLRFTAGQLTLSGRHAVLGDATEHVDILYEGADTTLTLNGSYLLEFLNVGTQPATTVTWKDGSTVLFVDSETYRYVQMPMRTV